MAHGKHLAQHLGDFYRGSTHQYRTSCLNQFFDFLDNSFILFAFRLVNAVVHILSCNRTVGRDHDYVQFVDIPKFACFRFSSTGHTRQFVIHTEVVLQSNRCKGLRSSFHFHTFLGFDSLVQSVRVAATFHDTTCLLVYDLHLSVDHYIFIIFLEHGVSLQQLVDGVYTFRFDGIVCQKFIFLFKQLFVSQMLVFQFRKLSGDVRKNEQCRVFRVTGNQVYPLVCQVYTIQFLVDYEIQRISNFMHALVVLFHVDFFRLEHTCLDTLFTKELNQSLVFRQCLVAAV